jgi:pimeloyl-ACP methyl ester carboxylesterase
VAEKYFLMDLESPRWKQLFAYLTQSKTEAELDAVMSAMTLEGHLDKITCPTLLAVGEYDPRGPLDEIYRMFDQLKAPSELWVFADQHHMPSIGGGDSGTNNWAAPLHAAMCDWLRDRFADKPLRHPGQAVYVEANSAGPNSEKPTLKRRWYET